jgi:NAD(P)-dependent dehydrogenase (short-subunit alcohol dehydrogenase family)
MAGLTAVGEFRPDAEAAARLAERFGIPADAAGSIEFAVLLLSSYIVGMEVPGERALYFKGSFRFAAAMAPASGPMTWSTKVVSRNAFNLLRQDLTVFMAGTTVCEAKISAMVRPMAVRTAVDTLPRSEVFRGRTALVIGASRGLGAAIASALVKQGATVLGSYLHGAASMEALAGSLVGESGTLVPVQGNAADAAWCSSILAQHGPPDYLILNACPTVRALKLERETLSRIHSYLDEAFGLVSVPVAVFAGEVRSCSVLISSIYVEEPVKDFPHYAAAKSAAEGYFQVAAMQFRTPGYLIVRPPKLLTDMTNTPYGTADVMAPEQVASALAARLLEPPAAGIVDMLRFGSAAAASGSRPE